MAYIVNTYISIQGQIQDPNPSAGSLPSKVLGILATWVTFLNNCQIYGTMCVLDPPKLIPAVKNVSQCTEIIK